MNDPRPIEHCPRCDADTERYANGECAPCRRAVSKRYYDRNAENRRVAARQRRIENPEQYRASQAKYRERHAEERAAATRAWRATNRDRVRAYQREAARHDPEANRAKVRRWAAENPEQATALRRAANSRRRARLRGAVTDDHSPHDIFQRDDGQCQISLHPDCRGQMELSRTSEWHIDHRQPLSRGGSHTRDNVQLSCDRCNRFKGARTMEEVEALEHLD